MPDFKTGTPRRPNFKKTAPPDFKTGRPDFKIANHISIPESPASRLESRIS
jgi:hypothetical protein